MKLDLILQIGKKLKEIRTGRKITQEELADMAGISPSFLGMIERGERILSIMTLFRLCKALDVTSDALLESGFVHERKVRYSADAAEEDPVIARIANVLKNRPDKDKKLALKILKKMFRS